jgi:hypothetical protein
VGASAPSEEGCYLSGIFSRAFIARGLGDAEVTLFSQGSQADYFEGFLVFDVFKYWLSWG